MNALKESADIEKVLNNIAELDKKVFKSLLTLEEKKLEELAKIRMACLEEINTIEIEYSNKKFQAKNQCEKELAIKQAEYEAKKQSIELEYKSYREKLNIEIMKLQVSCGSYNMTISKYPNERESYTEATTAVEQKVDSKPIDSFNKYIKHSNIDNKDTKTNTPVIKVEKKNKDFFEVNKELISGFLYERNKDFQTCNLEYLKVSDEFVSVLNNRTLGQWLNGDVVDNITLSKGAKGGDFVVSKDIGNNEYLIAPSTKALFNLKTVVSSGYIYFFDFNVDSIRAGVKMGADCENIKPALVVFDGEHYVLKEKGSFVIK